MHSIAWHNEWFDEHTMATHDPETKNARKNIRTDNHIPPHAGNMSWSEWEIQQHTITSVYKKDIPKQKCIVTVQRNTVSNLP